MEWIPRIKFLQMSQKLKYLSFKGLDILTLFYKLLARKYFQKNLTKKKFVFQVNLYEILKPYNSLVVLSTWQQFNLDRDDFVVDNIKFKIYERTWI